MPTHFNCNDIVDFTFAAGKLFIVVALLAALAMALAEAVAIRETGGRKDYKLWDPAAAIGALKDLLLALGNLPAWFAIFIAGGALIWFARDTLSLCP